MEAPAGPRPMCSLCRVRPAVYYRRFSGHRLCRRCMKTALERGVKRSLRGSNVFRPGVSILVYPSATNPPASLAFARLVGLVERSYGARVYAVLPSYIKVYSGLGLLRDSVELVELPAQVERAAERLESVVWAPRLLRLERGLASVAAELLGLDAAVLPITRTVIGMIGVEALISASLHYMWDLDAPQAGGGRPVVLGLRNVEAEFITGYAALERFDASSRVKPKYSFKYVYKALVTDDKPELEFSSASTISLLARALEGGKCRCKACGAPIACGKEFCEDCQSVWG
ncbi:ATPase [Aeropyrum camini]|uniref:Predicted ATPase n=1 Tax=Aeropyrum camini SY1 = JCM 12091 TaxID=1198449 RepID=U3TAP0_9CREN|nr:ATPase [Aeropyrum camini]BAN90597.1 predicted ATPase [Aeropyrum camini SY1 = JCM 12091]